MNKKNNIDQLFANKLQGAGATPSKAAWEQLEANLSQNKQSKAGLWVKIAAAVVILLVATLSWKFFSLENNASYQFAEASEEFLQAPYPKQMQITEINMADVMAMADAYDAENKKIEKNIFPVQPSNATQHLPSISDQKMEELVALQESKSNQPKEVDPVGNSVGNPVGNPTNNTEITDIASIKTAVALQEEPVNLPTGQVDIKSVHSDIDMKNVVAGTSDELPKVTITYLGKEETEKEKSKFSIKKVFKSAKKLANGDLIAELRGAKDGFINSKLKSGDDD